jgi:hypothetical protein
LSNDHTVLQQRDLMVARGTNQALDNHNKSPSQLSLAKANLDCLQRKLDGRSVKPGQ